MEEQIGLKAISKLSTNFNCHNRVAVG